MTKATAELQRDFDILTNQARHWKEWAEELERSKAAAVKAARVSALQEAAEIADQTIGYSEDAALRIRAAIESSPPPAAGPIHE